MEEIFDIIEAIISNTPWFALMYIVHEICNCIRGIKNLNIRFRDLLHVKS